MGTPVVIPYGPSDQEPLELRARRPETGCGCFRGLSQAHVLLLWPSLAVKPAGSVTPQWGWGSPAAAWSQAASWFLVGLSNNYKVKTGCQFSTRVFLATKK